jgi:hypothetical protein
MMAKGVTVVELVSVMSLNTISIIVRGLEIWKNDY